MPDQYIELARQAIDEYIKNQVRLKIPDNLPDEFYNKQTAIFVSIHTKKTNELKGCIGSLEPEKNNLAEEIIEKAIFACSGDPRFSPLTSDELDDIEVKVDVLSPLKKIKDKSELDPKKYGIYIKARSEKSALLLPDLEGIDTIEQQVMTTLQKGGIAEDEDINIFRFTVERHE